MSLRAKLLVGVLLLTTLSLGSVGLFVAWNLQRWSHDVLDAELLARANVLSGLVELDHDGELEIEGEHDAYAADPGHPFRIESDAGAVLFSTPFAWPPLPAASGPQPVTVTTADGRALRVLTRSIAPVHAERARGATQTFRLRVAVDEQPFHALGDRLLRGLGVALLGALALGALGASLLARATLRPVTQLATAIEAIELRSLRAELPSAQPDPELARLTRSFEALLARLHEALARERAFVARASHALRTPLATLRTQAEVTLRRPRTVAQYEAALRELERTTREATALTDGLLALARAEDGAALAPVGPVELRALQPALQRLIEPRAQEAARRVVWELPAGLAVQAEASALIELLTALLDNALRYGGPGGALGLRAAADGDEVTLTVWDEGPGLSAAEHAAAFQRFFRGEAARVTGAPGSGLGLALARAIAERFRGTLCLAGRAGGGLEALLRLPRA